MTILTAWNQGGRGSVYGAMEYCFGLGDGDVTYWDTAPDAVVLPAALDGLGLDGLGLDAVVLDFDGDGLRDDVLWDRAGTGSGEVALIDVQVEPHGERAYIQTARITAATHAYSDNGGDGTWATAFALPVADGAAPAGLVPPADPAPAAANPPVDQAPAAANPAAPILHRVSAAEIWVTSGGVTARLVDGDGDGYLDGWSWVPQ